ncbi:cyclic nucleotide-binding domain protein (macronuclear) [Tetrahymena thermophila SB210]|uniref:Cyclic nucleotide-binding domain protein n=1 Tax=Tetrahymena thermophila (strain SB210) TaxID=312017 RepID=Q22B68_TETTS|nr:cyclic nucleotide-binding domain protein [Tetrahymena thermophila SB210]EAR82533.2 cyclic nucleotide-binding domain protein [Tetrahymena thermophila SB210]|eukprot:XP_001030196.2 cyclic nucleotide-binding domain protein [Tetrahymena thermophila SB210]
MITIGYGDVYPINVYEMIYVIVMAIFSCGVFGYCVNTIGSIFTEIQQKSKQFQKKLYDISTYMNIKSIKKDTQIKILKQLEYLEDQRDEILLKGELILKQCSVELREELIQQYFGKILNNIPILKENFTTQLIDKVSLRMKEKILSPGELFIIQGQTVDNLCIITQGIVEYSTVDRECQRALLQISKDIKLIGFQQFLTRQTSEVSIQAKTATTLAFISYEEFQSIIKQIDLDYEKFCMVRDQFKNDKRYYIKCCSCGQYGHDLNLCGQLHYVVNRSTFSRRIFHNQIQEKRMSQFRKISQKYNTLGYNQQVKLDFKLYRWTAVQEIYKDYKDINILYEIQYQEKDRDFFRRCPKIKQKKLKFLRKQSFYDKQAVLSQQKSLNQVNLGEQSEHYNFDTQININDEDDEQQQENSSSSFESSSLSSSSSSEESKIARLLNDDQKEVSQYLRQQQNQSQDFDKSIYSVSISSQKNIQQQNGDVQQQFETFDEIKDQQLTSQKVNNEIEDEKKLDFQDQKYNQQAKLNIQQPQQQQNSEQSNIQSDLIIQYQGQFLQDFNSQSGTKPQLVRNLSINSQSSKNKSQNLVFQNRMQSNSLASNNNSSNQTEKRHQSVNLNLTDEEQSQAKTSKLGVSDIQQNSNPSKKTEKNNEKQSIISFIEQNQKRNKKVVQQAQQIQILQQQQEQQTFTVLIENLFEQFKKSIAPNKLQNNTFQYLSPNINLQQQQQNQRSQTQIKRSNKDLLYSNSISSKEESGMIQQQQNDTNTITIGSENKIKIENIAVPQNTQSIQNTMTNNNYKADQNHIFGKLQFKFDKPKEFQIYYPQFNLQSIIKSYKKMKYQLNQRIKPKKLKFFTGTQQQISQSPTMFKKQQRPFQSSVFKINDLKGQLTHQDVDMTFSYQ